MHRSTTAAAQKLRHAFLRPLERFLSVETAGGVVLLAATVLALLCANSPWSDAYARFWAGRVAIGPLAIPEPKFWVNEVLLTVFFMIVGIEIRQELRHGVLSERHRAALPVFAAAMGVLVPALTYLAIAPDAWQAWAVPTATDIAFAVGVLSLVGGAVPRALRVLLLTLAIADDIIAVAIIAVCYTGGIEWLGLVTSGVATLAIVVLARSRTLPAPLLLVPAAALWWGLREAGIHPTLAGVTLGLLMPARASTRRFGAFLHPWVAYAVMPLFALANAGVGVGELSHSGVAIRSGVGIVAALVLGKPLGILLGARVAIALRLGALPQDVSWPHLRLLGCLGGIGFTMAIFIADLAFRTPEMLETGKFAIIAGSTLAALIGWCAGHAARRRSARVLIEE